MATQIAEVETDKADMVLEAFDDGVLDEIKLKEGESAKVGEVIATLQGRRGAATPSQAGRRARKGHASGSGAGRRRARK